MSWNRDRIDAVALASAPADYAAFERIGLTEVEDARVLDVGCFDGFNTVLKFAPYGNIAQVVGLDPDGGALELAREATDDARFAWREGSFEDFAAEEPFDLIYFGHTFQHLPDKAAAARKAFDLLKPGGWLVIKTVDDSLKASSPDPDQLMRRVFARYEEAVRPNMPHTANTDRNNGAKCYGLLVEAGFDPVEVAVSHATTAAMAREEREAFFDRMTYFRNPVIDGERDPEMTALLEAWHNLFLQENYYFDSPTLVVCGQKPMSRRDRPNDSSKMSHLACPFDSSFTIDRMTEGDLGDVMAIELRSFPNPWAPVAFATELRHNRDATYAVARNAEGQVQGYIGWWAVESRGLITHVAVSPDARRCGLGTLLVETACAQAAAAGAVEMQLQFREHNDKARALYASRSFREIGRIPAYYANPEDDAIVMARPLSGATEEE